MKKIYLAGRLDTEEGKIADLSDELEQRNHVVIEQWFREGRLPKPYLDNLNTSEPAAARMIKAAFESDVFILHPTDDILGAAVEFGAALGSSELRIDKYIYIVDPYNVRQSVFYAHPAVMAVRGLDEIRKAEWY